MMLKMVDCAVFRGTIVITSRMPELTVGFSLALLHSTVFNTMHHNAFTGVMTRRECEQELYSLSELAWPVLHSQ